MRVDEACERCGLYKTCKSPFMPVTGAERPVYLFVGEGPGADEDTLNMAFVGDSGELLREDIESSGIPLDKCAFTNSVRCRPPNNDIKFQPRCVEFCRPKLLREIHALNPRVVTLLGNTAIDAVGHLRGVTKLNGEVFQANGRYYVISVHPSYALRGTQEGDNTKRTMLRQALSNVSGVLKQGKSGKKKHYIVVRDKRTLYEVVDHLKKQKELATDIESSSLSPYAIHVKPAVGCVGFSWEPYHAACLPVHARVGEKIPVRSEEMLEAIKELWEDKAIRYILHFGKFDYLYMLVLEGILLENYWFDTGQASYVLDERKGIHALKHWAWKLERGGYELPLRDYQRVHPEEHMNLVPGSILYPYNMEDCDVTGVLKGDLFPKLKEQGLYDRPFRFPQMWNNWLAAMLEIAGIRIDLARNAELLEEFPEKIRGLDKQVRRFPAVAEYEQQRYRKLMEAEYERVSAYKRPLAPEKAKARVLELTKNHFEPCKFTSPDVVREIIFDVLGYEPLWATKKGNKPSAEREVLEKLAAKHPKDKFLPLLVERRSSSSSFSKYVAPIHGWVLSDGRSHSDFNPASQKTGRVNSSKPDHENLPKRQKIAPVLRSQFVSSGDGWFLLEGDEKQGELRLMADRSQDKNLVHEFNSGIDPHRMAAAKCYTAMLGREVKYEDVTKDQRNNAKNAVSFGIIYGRGDESLSADLGLTLVQGKKLRAGYFEHYHGVAAYIEAETERLPKVGVAISHFNRHRRLRPAIDDERPGVRNEAIREGINAPIQGDLSDVVWTAGHRLRKWMLKYHFKSKIVIINHDAIIGDIWHKELQDVIEMQYKFMTDREFLRKMTGWYMSVPLDVDFTLGASLANPVELVAKKPGEFIIPPQFN